MNKPTVEYLIIFQQEDTFCNSESAFLNFIEVDSSIKVDKEKKKIVYEKTTKGKNNILDISYLIETNIVPQKTERYFKLLFTIPSLEKIRLFDEFTCCFEKNVLKLHKQISVNILWNDISRQYAIEGYTIINEVENLLRRLIANFMLVNVGIDWAKYHIPNEVEKRNPTLKVSYTDFLYQTYFSDLKTILFGGQRDYNFRDIGEVQKFVEKCISEKKTVIPVIELKGVISTSLWEKYFSAGTEYKKENLEKDLETLNELRNEIAHNRHITKEILGKIKTISNKVIKTLKLEIKDLPNKILTEKDKLFQSDIQRYRFPDMSSFGYWCEKVVFNWYEENYPNAIIEHNLNAPADIEVLEDFNTIGVYFKAYKEFQFGIKQLRNAIAHGTDRNLLMFLSNEKKEYDEKHIVIVLKENMTFDKNNDYLITIQSYLSSFHPLKIIVGYIDDYQFEKLYESDSNTRS